MFPSSPREWRGRRSRRGIWRIWIQQFCREVTEGRQEVRRREKLPEGDGLPPGRDRLISPYDLDARYSIKRETGWGGYKVHFTETCDAPGPGPDAQDAAGPGAGPARVQGRGEPPNLVTNVVTTEATVPDSAMTTPVHQNLGGKDLLPGEHLVDPGYPSAELIIHAARVFGITLVSPMLLDTSAQAMAERARNARSGRTEHPCDARFGRDVGHVIAETQRQIDQRRSAGALARPGRITCHGSISCATVAR